METKENRYVLEKPVFLVGFMGAGKSSVGRNLARRYGFELVDADDYLEAREGKKIAQIFDEDGEDHFRDLETKYLRELSEKPCIVSTGGGVIKRSENIRIMKESGYVIYLSVTAEAAASRIKDASSRPLFKNLETARKTIAERAPLYEEAADSIVDTVDQGLRQISNEVFRLMEEHDLLGRV